MKIHPELLASCLKDLKQLGTLTAALLMRRYGIKPILADAILSTIAKIPLKKDSLKCLKIT